MKRSWLGTLQLAVAVVLLLALGFTTPSAQAQIRVPELAFSNGDEVRAVGADGRGERTIATAGKPVDPTVLWTSVRVPAWSPDGTRVAYVRRSGSLTVAASSSELRVASADGSKDELLWSSSGIIEQVQWSPDGRRLAFVLWTPNPAFPVTWTDVGSRWDIYLINVDGSGLRPVAPVHVSVARSLDFSPDGTKLAFISDQQGVPGVYTIGVDETGLPVRVSPPYIGASDPSWSPNGKRLVFSGTSLLDATENITSAPLIWTVHADGSRAHQLAARTWHPSSWSPDGRWLVYAGPLGINMIRANGRAERILTSAKDYQDYWPVWSRHGHIAFVRGDRHCCVRTLWVMNADGSNQHQVSNASEVAFDITWSE